MRHTFEKCVMYAGLSSSRSTSFCRLSGDGSSRNSCRSATGGNFSRDIERHPANEGASSAGGAGTTFSAFHRRAMISSIFAARSWTSLVSSLAVVPLLGPVASGFGSAREKSGRASRPPTTQIIPIRLIPVLSENGPTAADHPSIQIVPAVTFVCRPDRANGNKSDISSYSL